MEMRVADKSAVAEAGSVVLVNASHGNHGVPARGADGFRYDVVSFDISGVPELSACNGAALLELHAIANQEALDALFREAARLDHEPSSAIREVFRKIAVMRLLQAIHQALASPPTARRSLLDKALWMMERRLGDAEFKTSDIARELNISANYLGRLFREELGVSPLQTLLRLRLERARLHLHHSVSSVKEIASASGFSDQLYFSRIFRRRFGGSPLAFRKALDNASRKGGGLIP